MNMTKLANTKCPRCHESSPGNEHRSQTDKRVESRHKLRHGRHGNAIGNHSTNPATDDNATHNHAPGQAVRRLQQRQCSCNSNGHTDHAVNIALPRCDRR